MSIKFVIKGISGKAEREGDEIVRFSGASEPFKRGSERDCKIMGLDDKGNPKIHYNTGLDKNQIQFYQWFSDEEKKLLEEQIDSLSPTIYHYYGGKEFLDPANKFFWQSDRSVSKICVTEEVVDKQLFDTSKPEHALLYLSIASGAFMDVIAPTKDWAERFQLPHYIVLENESNANMEDEDDIRRSDAHAALSDLKKNHGKDALFILTWCIQYETASFGAITYSVSEKDLLNYHIKYIDGKLVMKRKRNTPKVFLDYYDKWCAGGLVREALYREAYVKAGEYFSFVQQRDKKYTTADGTILGNTIPDAVTALSKIKFKMDLDKLKEQVESKWKE